jgi:hypothetical protein
MAVAFQLLGQHTIREEVVQWWDSNLTHDGPFSLDADGVHQEYRHHAVEQCQVKPALLSVLCSKFVISAH